MSVIVVGDSDQAVMADDTAGIAFGPLHLGGRNKQARAELQEFVSAIYDDINTDPRRLTDESLFELYDKSNITGQEYFDPYQTSVFDDIEAAKEAVETTR